MGLEVITSGASESLPPPPLGDGRGEVPGGDLGANPIAVERASARRGVGRQPHMVDGLKQGVRLPFALVRDVVLSGSGCMI